MSQLDQRIRATAAQGKIRVVGVVSTQAVEEARSRHGLSYVATVALGRTMSGALLLAANLKQSQARINLQVKGDGPLGKVWVDAGANGTVRGYIENPTIELPLTEDKKLNVGAAVGRSGYLHAIRDTGRGNPYTSTVELVSGEIGDDITSYLLASEQTPSVVVLGVMVNRQGVQAAGGLLLQILPGAPTTIISDLEQRLTGSEEISPLLARGYSLPELMKEIFGDLDLEILPGEEPIRFYCPCSFQRVKGALRILGNDELKEMIQANEVAEATCHFCGEVYRVPVDELKELLTSVDPDSL